ncbi:helix-turn-helix domain-containing protein [Acinetobacter towneri]|jgi:transcriptional regulator with XRE-family HTH domain|uniref:helix-turn-helix domain-containing protein n=1 Tax=Acinetobacter towneri TaxID=202956 RepID=UPI00321563F8
MNKIEQRLGDQLKIVRLKKGLTQEQLAELSGLHRTYIGSVERGERNITVKNLYKILLAMNCSLSDFFKSW